jgi:hypothetical protein
MPEAAPLRQLDVVTYRQDRPYFITSIKSEQQYTKHRKPLIYGSLEVLQQF